MCDLSDPRIVETYTAITQDDTTNWYAISFLS